MSDILGSFEAKMQVSHSPLECWKSPISIVEKLSFQAFQGYQIEILHLPLEWAHP